MTRLVKIAVTLRHVYRLLDIRRSPMSHWAYLCRVVAEVNRIEICGNCMFTLFTLNCNFTLS